MLEKNLNLDVLKALTNSALGLQFSGRDNALSNTQRATLFDSSYDEILSFIIQQLYGLPALDENADDYSERSYIVNTYMLACFGVGAYQFILDEHLSALKVSSCESVYDYAEMCYQLNQELDKDTDIPPRQFFDMSDWIRFFDKQYHLWYGTLYSPSHYLAYELGDDENQLINELVPHHYEKGPKHGEKAEKGDYTYWDMNVNANGLEDVYRRLQALSRQTIKEMSEGIIKQTRNLPPGAYVIDSGQEHTKDIVLLNDASAKGVRLTHFIEDVEVILCNDNEFDKLIHSYKVKFKETLLTEYELCMKDR